MGHTGGMRRTGWLVLAFALFTGPLLAAVLVFLHGEAVRSGREQVASLSQVIAEQTTRTLQAVDVRLQLAIARLEALEQSGRAGTDAGRALLRGELKDLPYVRALWVVDASGRVLYDSDTGTTGRAVADRAYFQAYLRSPETEFFVGPLVRSRTTGTWYLSASRPIRGPDGAVKAVVTAALEPGYFEQPWRGIDLGEQGAVVLYHRSGQLMVRSPPDEAVVGRDFAQLPLFTEFLPAAPQGVFVRDSDIDGLRRMYAYRVLPHYPQLLVVVGTGYAELLAPWWRFALLASSLWAGALLVVFGLTWQLRRQARRRSQTEQRFGDLAQAMPQIVFSSDARGGVQFISQRWTDFTGRSAEDARGTRWRDAVHPADRDVVFSVLARALEQPRQVEIELRLRHHDGSYRWHLLRAVPVGSPAAVRTWYGTATDIDEMKRAQARLHAQAELLKMAGRLSRLGSFSVDVATERVTWSDESAALFDMPSDAEPTLKDVIAMVAPASLPQALHVLQDCIDRGEPFDVEAEMITPTGRRVWVRSIGQPVRGLDGRIIAIQGAQQDISQRVRMVEEIRSLNTNLEEKISQRTGELARQEALFRTLAEQAPLPFWTVDPAGGATFFSRAWYELFGGAPPKWLGHEWMELLHPDDSDAVQRNWQEARRTDGVYAGTRRLRSRDGTWHTTSYRAVPVRDGEGEVLFWVGVDSDITELSANESALRLANEQLESFAYSVSHDLQSPLQRIQSFGRLLEEELRGAAGERAQHYLARIRANADAMAQLIEGLLGLAHVSEVEIIRSTVNLSETATEILQRLHADHPQRRVEWRVEPGLTAQGDVRLLRSVLENLLGNAWKFTAARPLAQITVGGGRGEFFVRDNGAGFDMAYADRLFGTFQRLHDADEFPGKGIGLATVARAISRMGGRIWAQSAPGEGATFRFTLPAVQAVEPSRATA
ncbi:PAS domain-containing protein [Ramlibacter sp. G-1-2-2]|uniref:histidine kinase n=1 Tax=Ramlibacter agri TaxID=2728837 RepID=A0A848H336_9BURK|nr:PAS domain-containing protein [Ramlibacter agri]NML44984.1 PAS domain-containing protein [Ramlibacter agri]